MSAAAPAAAPGRSNLVAYLVAGAFFMELLDGTVIATALPTMAAAMGVEAVDLNAGMSAYMLTVAVFILPSAWLAARFGARPVFTGAILLFTAASVLCGLTSTAHQFIATRVLQGIGGAMMVPVGRLVVLRSTPKSELINAIAVLTWPGLTAPVIGPALGGFITQYASWRWIFFINVPIGLAGFLLALRLVPKVGSTSPDPFDWPGFIGGALLCTGVTLSLEWLGAGTTSWYVPALMALACVVVWYWLLRHLRRSPHPILDLAPLRVPAFRLALPMGTFTRGLIAAVPFLLPLMFQVGFGMDPVRSGLLVLTLFIGNLGIKPATSWVMRRWSFRHVLVVNGLLQAATVLACAALAQGSPVPVIIAVLVVSGASRSMQFTAVNTLNFADVPQQSMPAANAMVSISLQLAAGLGITVGAVLLRLAAMTQGGEHNAAAFRFAFIALASLAVALALGYLRLAPTAGAEVRKPG